VGRLYEDISDDPSDPRHGTVGGYNNHRCRCERCTETHRISHRLYMQESPLQQRRRQDRRVEAARREAERAAERQRQAAERRANWTPPRQAQHGTRRSYLNHKRHGETPCDKCIEANRKYNRERSKRRRQNPSMVPGDGNPAHGTYAGAKNNNCPCPDCRWAARVRDNKYRRKAT